MALSGFIKQLLETDTVFGSEAKKMTGINDAVIKKDFAIVEISLQVINAQLRFTVHNYDTTRPLPSWIQADKYIVFNFTGYDNTAKVAIDLVSYEAKLFQIGSVNLTGSVLTIIFKPNVEGTPDFSRLPQINNLTPVSVRMDGRIFALIGDPDIARMSTSGSTMFNVDNMETTGRDADSSGIARKFASHYHTDVAAEVTLNTLDENGNPLARVIVNDVSSEQLVNYDATAAFNQALADDNNGLGIRVEADTGTGTPTTIAQYGQIGRKSKGRLCRMIAVPYSRGFTVDASTPELGDLSSVDVESVGTNNEQEIFLSNLGPDIPLSSLYGFEVPRATTGSINITGRPTNTNSVFLRPTADSATGQIRYEGVDTRPLPGSSVPLSQQFLLSDNNNITAENLRTAIELTQPLLWPERVGSTVSIVANYPDRGIVNQMLSNDVSMIAVLTIGNRDEASVKQIAADNLTAKLNEILTAYVFTRVAGPGTDQDINYISKTNFLDDMMTREGTSPPVTAFTYDAVEDTGAGPVAISGNEFITLGDLNQVLKFGTDSLSFGFDIELIDNAFFIKSESGVDKTISFIQPAGGLTIWANLFKLAAGVVNLPVDTEITTGVVSKVPQLVFDNRGSAVLNLPTLIYTEGASVVP